MSDDKTPRKPRFFHPGETDLPKERAEATNQAADEAVPQKKQAASAEKKAEPQPAPPPHRPQDKMAKDADDEASAQEEAQTASTLPTLEDVKRGIRWTGLLMSAAGALAVMAFTSWMHSYIADLIARDDWIGWMAIGLVALVCLALFMIAIKEMLALRRLGKIGKMRQRAELALMHDERKQAQRLQKEITALFRGRSSLKWGLAELKEHKSEVLSSRDRLLLVERSLLVPLDRDAQRIVAQSARRVSVMTAISPFVFLDMLMVGVENFRMMRRLMSLYGGRPAVLSQFQLIKKMIANLAMSGGVAVGADLVGHIMGRQVATRLAGRIGEGVINGTLTARLGITASKLIRPLPYIEAKPVTITAFVKELTKGGKNKG